MVRTAFIAVLVALTTLLYSHSSFALSCSYWDELQNPSDIAEYDNIIEAKVINASYDDAAQKVILNVETIEVFIGDKINTYSIIDMSSRIAGAPNIGYSFKNLADKKNSYSNLVGKNVVLLGSNSSALCTDGIVELFKLPQPDLLRGFLRCITPALEFAETIDTDRKYLTGLPGKHCKSSKYNTTYSPQLDGVCNPADPRMSWIEELSGTFLNAKDIALRVLCPNPVSKQ